MAAGAALLARGLMGWGLQLLSDPQLARSSGHSAASTMQAEKTFRLTLDILQKVVHRKIRIGDAFWADRHGGSDKAV